MRWILFHSCRSPEPCCQGAVPAWLMPRGGPGTPLTTHWDGVRGRSTWGATELGAFEEGSMVLGRAVPPAQSAQCLGVP